MKPFSLSIVFFFCLPVFINGQTELNFNNIDSVFTYAERNSTAIKTGDEQSLLAKWTLIAADANTINLRNNITFSALDNVKLPVNYIPAEAFGGPKGTYREITLGQQYVSTLAVLPQIDIINLSSWAKVKSAQDSKKLTEVNNLVTKKNLFESIAACYFNIVSLQGQVKITKQNLVNADSVLMMVKNKYNEGIAKSQDVNNATVNQLNIKNQSEQIKLSLQQQFNSLKLLCDIPSSKEINIDNAKSSVEINYEELMKANGGLMQKQVQLQESIAKSELRSNRFTSLPVVSLVGGFNWIQNSNDAFFDNNAKWTESDYIGLKITLPFPNDVNKLSQTYTSKVNYHISKLNFEHSQLSENITNEQLGIDYSKAISTYKTTKEIYNLKKDNYTKSENQYREGILSTDLFLTSFNDLLNAELNVSNAKASLEYSKSKIEINNKIK